MGLAVGALVGAAPSWAQTAPSAGVLQQQIERERELGTAPRLPVKPQPETLTALPPAGPTVVVKSFNFEGNTLLSKAELDALLAPLLNRPLDFAQLQSSALRVADAYRAQGWVVNAFLPGQELPSGEVTLRIEEAVFGKTLFNGQPAQRVASQNIEAIFERQQPAGAFLNLNALDRALLLADDLPGVTVSGSMAPGALNGQTDLVLALSDEALLAGNVSSDNTGSVSTGVNRVSAALNLNSPARWGDALSLNLMASAGTRYVRLGYSVPLGSDGWRLSVNASRLNYELVSDVYKDLNAKGDANSAGLELSYPLVRTRSLNLNTSLSADRKDYFNTSGGATTSTYRAIPVTLAANASVLDSLGGGGANAASLALTLGSLDLNGSPTQASDASSTQTEGHYQKLRYNISRQQQIVPGWSFYGALSGQWANKNLDSSEKFYLGGSAGVRAYPGSEGGGAWGHQANLELRWQLAQGVNVAGFYDYGHITINPNNDFAGAATLNSYALKGAGVSLGWQNATGLSLKATLARRAGSNPNPSSTGSDQDGTLKINRAWFTAALPF